MSEQQENSQKFDVSPDNEVREFHAIVGADPTIELPIGSELYFSTELVKFTHEPNEVNLRDWHCLEGLVLALHFKADNTGEVDGSAVLVAPGIALCATHVVKPRIEPIMRGDSAPYAIGIASHGGQIWMIRKISSDDGSDISILGLELRTALPPDGKFRQAYLSTRIPKIGENLWLVGLRASAAVFPLEADGGINLGAQMIVTKGTVSAHYLSGRDRSMAPFPCIQVDAKAWGGMSGGPVFDEEGYLIGLLSSSLGEDGPSCVCLVFPALTMPFEGGLGSKPSGKQTLLSMIGEGCSIERPESIRTNGNGGSSQNEYSIWYERSHTTQSEQAAGPRTWTL